MAKSELRHQIPGKGAKMNSDLIFGPLAKNPVFEFSNTAPELLTNYFGTSVFSNGFQHPRKKSKHLGSRIIYGETTNIDRYLYIYIYLLYMYVYIHFFAFICAYIHTHMHKLLT